MSDVLPICESPTMPTLRTTLCEEPVSACSQCVSAVSEREGGAHLFLSSAAEAGGAVPVLAPAKPLILVRESCGGQLSEARVGRRRCCKWACDEGAVRGGPDEAEVGRCERCQLDCSAR